MEALAAFLEGSLEVDSHLVVGNLMVDILLMVDNLKVDNLVERLGGLEEGILEEGIQEEVEVIREDSPMVPFLEDRVVGIPLEEAHHHEPQPPPLQQQLPLVLRLSQIYGFPLLLLPLHPVSGTL